MQNLRHFWFQSLQIRKSWPLYTSHTHFCALWYSAFYCAHIFPHLFTKRLSGPFMCAQCQQLAQNQAVAQPVHTQPRCVWRSTRPHCQRRTGEGRPGPKHLGPSCLRTKPGSHRHSVSPRWGLLGPLAVSLSLLNCFCSALQNTAWSYYWSYFLGLIKILLLLKYWPRPALPPPLNRQIGCGAITWHQTQR